VDQSRSGLRGEEKIRDPTGTRALTPRSSSQEPVAVLTALSQFLTIMPYGVNMKETF
jgi:hypothetical protein